MKNRILATGIISAILFTASSLAFAKELASGGVITPAATACDPVKSITYKGDATTGETGLASITVNYSVSPCDKTVPVRIGVTMVETASGVAFYTNNDSLLSDKFTMFGVKPNTSYVVTVTVYNTTTGEVLKTSSIFAAARYKRV